MLNKTVNIVGIGILSAISITLKLIITKVHKLLTVFGTINIILLI